MKSFTQGNEVSCHCFPDAQMIETVRNASVGNPVAEPNGVDEDEDEEDED